MPIAKAVGFFLPFSIISILEAFSDFQPFS